MQSNTYDNANTANSGAYSTGAPGSTATTGAGYDSTPGYSANTTSASSLSLSPSPLSRGSHRSAQFSS